jgi:hypothetical protein
MNAQKRSELQQRLADRAKDPVLLAFAATAREIGMVTLPELRAGAVPAGLQGVLDLFSTTEG